MALAQDPFERTARMLGPQSMTLLGKAKVAVFGLGGVGGHCAEALARSGVGAIDLYDSDTVSLTNINRQIAALHSTLGRPKAEVMAERVRDINPLCEVRAFELFYTPETADSVELSAYSYVADAIDTVAGKLELIARAKAAGVPIICAMGAGNKLDPTLFSVSDISKTETDPLARVLRRELRKRGIEGLKVVWSKEPPRSPVPRGFSGQDSPCHSEQDSPCHSEQNSPRHSERSEESHRACDGDSSPAAQHDSGRAPASNAFVPAVCGLILAGEIVKDLIKR